MHARLAAAARDCYPAAARRFRQLGRVPVRFCVGANLAAERLVLSPSGLALLDDAARECVVPRAAPFPAEAATRCFEVAVDFGP
ncbi:MAG: energy transducer TonB [Myxococcaceae bacterium]|nr:energy transducer TonB [Myxococcaceae bacterium]